MSDAVKYPPPSSLADVAAYHEHKARGNAREAEECRVNLKRSSGWAHNEASEEATAVRRKELWHQAAANVLQTQLKRGS